MQFDWSIHVVYRIIIYIIYYSIIIIIICKLIITILSLHNYTLQLTKLELRTSPGLAPSDLVAIKTRVAATTLQKNAISGMSAVYRGACHWSILLQNAPIRENVSRLFNNFYYCYELV